MANLNRVNLVDDNDQIVATADKFKAHLGEGLLHQAISLFLFKKNEAGDYELLCQKRSFQKIVGAGQWANTLCGNVAMEENHLACVKRRLKDELGLVLTPALFDRIEEVTVFKYFAPCNEKYSEREVDHLFVLLLEKSDLLELNLSLNLDEVSDVDWFNWQELLKNKNFKNKEIAPWFKLFLDEVKIIKQINQFLKNER